MGGQIFHALRNIVLAVNERKLCSVKSFNDSGNARNTGLFSGIQGVGVSDITTKPTETTKIQNIKNAMAV